MSLDAQQHCCGSMRHRVRPRMQGVAYSAERDELATCAVEKQARVWDAERLTAPHLTLSGHTGIVLQVLDCTLGLSIGYTKP